MANEGLGITLLPYLHTLDLKEKDQQHQEQPERPRVSVPRGQPVQLRQYHAAFNERTDHQTAHDQERVSSQSKKRILRRSKFGGLEHDEPQRLLPKELNQKKHPGAIRAH